MQELLNQQLFKTDFVCLLMKKKVIYALVLFAGIIVAICAYFAAGYFLEAQQQGYNFAGSPAKEVNSQCKILKNNVGNTNVLFFGSQADAEKYAEFLIGRKAFSAYAEDFNFYYIDDYEPACELYKGIALLCYSKDLIKKASACPHDYVVVLRDQAENIRSSSYMDVMSLNTNHPLSVFAHEFGHAFGNLADEYVGNGANVPRNSQNCRKKCDFDGMNEGCYIGCSQESYYRPSEESVMRDLSTDEYRKFNEYILSKRFSSTSSNAVTGNVISEESVDCSQQSYYLIELQRESGKLRVGGISLEKGCSGTNGFGGSEFLRYEMYGFSDNLVVVKESINPEYVFTDEFSDGETSGEVLESPENFFVTVPGDEDVQSAELRYGDQQLSIPIHDLEARPCEV